MDSTTERAREAGSIDRRGFLRASATAVAAAGAVGATAGTTAAQSDGFGG